MLINLQELRGCSVRPDPQALIESVRLAAQVDAAVGTGDGPVFEPQLEVAEVFDGRQVEALPVVDEDAVLEQDGGSRFAVHALRHLGTLAMQQERFADAADLYEQASLLLKLHRYSEAVPMLKRLTRLTHPM